MKTLTMPDENPFIKVRNNSVIINYNDRQYHFEIEDILSVYLKKSKMNYVPSFVSAVFAGLGKRYKLYIRTKDNTETQIKINPNEKKYFISLITQIKRSKNKQETDTAS